MQDKTTAMNYSLPGNSPA